MADIPQEYLDLVKVDSEEKNRNKNQRKHSRNARLKETRATTNDNKKDIPQEDFRFLKVVNEKTETATGK